MLERTRPSRRLLVGLGVLILCVLELQALIQLLRAQAALRQRVIRTTRESAVMARPRLGALLRSGGSEAWARAAREAIGSSLATEVELFDLSGRRLFAQPLPSPIERSLDDNEVEILKSGAVMTLGPFTGQASRLLTYLYFPSGDIAVVLRLSTAVPELAADLRDRRQLLMGHGLALFVLVLAGSLALFPGAARGPESRTRALEAYERAMEKLRDHGNEVSREHAEARRKMNEVLHDKEALARAGELTAGIVHEVRNGLGTILGYARFIETTPPLAEGTGAAKKIVEECEILETVIRRFVDFVKREKLCLAPFDLGRMLSRVAARESRGRNGGAVSVEEAKGGVFLGDEELLERAFENLVRNAREASGEGGHVWVGVTREAETAVITVADDGPGLSAPSEKELRPFFTTKPGGLGLGLPIALKIVQLHEGELRLENRSPRGLIVRVRLPIRVAAADHDVTEGNNWGP